MRLMGHDVSLLILILMIFCSLAHHPPIPGARLSPQLRFRKAQGGARNLNDASRRPIQINDEQYRNGR
jgi:hypothetical protein